MKTHAFFLLVLSFCLSPALYGQWETSGTTIYYNGGKVAVGTTSPTGIFHITGDYNANDASLSGPGGFLVIGNTNSTNIAVDNNEIMARNNGGATDLGLQADGGSITIHGSSSIAESQKIRISNDGSVGIGVLNIPAAYKLAVDGKVIAEEVRVKNSTSWPDYVFNPGYSLRPIEELEQHIRENGHLPGIPGAQEVAENGFDLGDMDRWLLEKVEELTLYLIALKKENAALLQRVTDLEAAIQPKK